MTHNLEQLAVLIDTVAARRGAAPETSYTASLLAKGVEACAKKLGEESVEAALAAMKADKAHLTKEAADVLFHLCVLLEASDVPFADVMAELGRRAGQSGHDEKARRG